MSEQETNMADENPLASYEAGKKAFRDGRSRNDNPHSWQSETQSHVAWEMGWDYQARATPPNPR